MAKEEEGYTAMDDATPKRKKISDLITGSDPFWSKPGSKKGSKKGAKKTATKKGAKRGAKRR